MDRSIVIIIIIIIIIITIINIIITTINIITTIIIIIITTIKKEMNFNSTCHVMKTITGTSQPKAAKAPCPETPNLTLQTDPELGTDRGQSRSLSKAQA